MGHTEWAMWANEQAVIACAITFIGGSLAVSSIALPSVDRHENWSLGAYAMAISLFIFMIEYPRGKRKKGNTLERKWQCVPAMFVSKLRVFGRNYFIRFVFYVLACVPCLVNLGSIMGGVCLLVTACIYLRAAIAGEEWTACAETIKREKTLTRVRPPSMAPPRLNPPATNYVYERDQEEKSDDENLYENAPNARV